MCGIIYSSSQEAYWGRIIFSRSVISLFFVCVVLALDLTYGVVLCFACHDYVYSDDIDAVAQSERRLGKIPFVVKF